jgi:eukaryotic-like serine/threonine-protein kinase
MHAMAGTGRVIAGRYRLKGPIGRGAMGTVWRAWDEVLDREVAVKELRISDGLDPDERAKAYQRTHREARTAARLSHPGLVTVFDTTGPCRPTARPTPGVSCWPPWPPPMRPACCTAT